MTLEENQHQLPQAAIVAFYPSVPAPPNLANESDQDSMLVYVEAPSRS